MRTCYCLNLVPLKVYTFVVLTLLPHNVTVFGDTVLKEIIKLNEVIKSGPSPAMMGYFYKKRKLRFRNAQREEGWRYRETMTICKPKRKTLEETNLPNTWISDFRPVELWENEFLLHTPLHFWYFVMADLVTNAVLPNVISILLMWTTKDPKVLCPGIEAV